MLHPELKSLCDETHAAGKKLSELQDQFAKGHKHRERVKSLLNFSAAFFAGSGFGYMVTDEVNFLNVFMVIVGVIFYFFSHKHTQKVEEKQQELEKYHHRYYKELFPFLEKTADTLYMSQVEKLERDMILVDWHDKPAVVFSGSHAYAIVKPKGDWIEVDGTSVLSSGKIIPDADTFDTMFKEQYGYRHSVIEFPSRAVLWSDSFNYNDYLDSIAWK